MYWDYFTANHTLILGSFSTLLWGIYVFFTIWTFREISKQTELQSAALLIVACQLQPSIPPTAINLLPLAEQTLYKKWTDIITKNIPKAEAPKQYVLLFLTNRGHSDIIRWKIKLNVEIFPGTYLANRNTIGDSVSWAIQSQGYNHIVGQGDTKTIIIAETGIFPKAQYQWNIEYYDMRDKKYSYFAGDKSTEAKNVLAFDYTDT
jgi:hypothetical protein